MQQTTPITKRVQTLDDIFAISGVSLESLTNPNDTIDETAYKIAKLIAKVYNEGEELDPDNTDQWKYFPVHRIIPGSGLSAYVFGHWHSNSAVGVRLCFKEASHAFDAGKKFIEVYTNLKIK